MPRPQKTTATFDHDLPIEQRDLVSLNGSPSIFALGEPVMESSHRVSFLFDPIDPDGRFICPDATPPLDPKRAAGALKPQLQLIPPVFNEAVAAALSHGAVKYGPWNWRENKVEMMTYLGAMKRHIDALLDGEDIAPDSGVHHLGHIAASCAIVLDAGKHGTLVDNRPPQKP